MTHKLTPAQHIGEHAGSLSFKRVAQLPYYLIQDESGDDYARVYRKDIANLIIAAPELLEFVERELQWLEHIKPQISAPDSVKLGVDQAIKYARAAIAKATGGAI